MNVRRMHDQARKICVKCHTSSKTTKWLIIIESFQATNPIILKIVSFFISTKIIWLWQAVSSILENFSTVFPSAVWEYRRLKICEQSDPILRKTKIKKFYSSACQEKQVFLSRYTAHYTSKKWYFIEFQIKKLLSPYLNLNPLPSVLELSAHSSTDGIIHNHQNVITSTYIFTCFPTTTRQVITELLSWGHTPTSLQIFYISLRPPLEQSSNQG